MNRQEREKTAHTQHHGESLAMASTYLPTVQHKQPTEQNESTALLAVARPHHDIHHGGTCDDDNRLAIKIKMQCQFPVRLKGEMFSYQLDLKETTTFTDTSNIIKRFSFGEPNRLKEKERKTILLMGETGSGKTTWINAMINYVVGVEFKDDFRFKLIGEEVRGGSQAHSQTQGITAYDLHYQNGFRIPFSLTLVDTPGFGDTRGEERDKEITATIKKFFEDKNGIPELDVIGFVVKSSDVRLTSSQTYIFDSVLSIFGKDMGENIRFLVTWADGGHSQVLAAITAAGLPCQMDSKGSPCHHNFNNGAVYTQPNKDFMASRKWKMSMKNFESFFRELNGMKTTSLQMTKNVLEMRKCLEVQLEFMWDSIDQQLTKIKQCRQIAKTIAQNKEKIDRNQNFEITIPVSKKVKDDVKNSQSALNCKNCEVTCHYSPKGNTLKKVVIIGLAGVAGIAGAAGLAGVASLASIAGLATEAGVVASFLTSAAGAASAVGVALGWETNSFTTCEVCPGKCPSSDHVNENSRWVYKEVEEKKTLFEVRKEYEEAMGQQATAEGTITSLKEEMEKLKSEILQALKDVTLCSNTLKKIALRDIPLTTAEYLRLKIENEKEEKKRGYEQRIDILKDILKTAKENLNEGEATAH